VKLVRFDFRPPPTSSCSSGTPSASGGECSLGAELELTAHDGTVRDLVFIDSGGGDFQQQELLVSGGAGNCHICLTDCGRARTVREFPGHTEPILGLYNWYSVNVNKL
jgi:hypothetical protein